MKRLVLLAALASAWVMAGPAYAQDTVVSLVQRAGNAATDEARLDILKELRGDAALADKDRADLDKLIAEIERWLNEPKLYYYDKPVLNTGQYGFGIAPESPLYPLTLLYEARMQIWVVLEYGGYWSDPAARRKRLDEIRPVIEQAAAAFPENPLLAMYLGKPLPPAKEYASPPTAPEWARQQREGLERLADIIEWWIDHRMRDDGQYGGGWGDDCEMWRWWVPVLIAFDEPKITSAQARFSRALLAQEHMKDGYTSRVSDVEHTAEDSSDVITPMMHLEPDAPDWRDRALRLVELTETLWSGINERGQRQFKSTYFCVDSVDPSPKRACDTVYHARALQPAFLCWQRTGDAHLGQLFTAWLDTWVDATARAERGKPAGVIPSAIHWPDGAIGGLGANWWDPENHNADPLYVWPSAMGGMTPTLLLAYHMTGDEKYLAPLRSMAAIRLRYLEERPENPEPGSEAWCGARMNGLMGALAKHRLLTGSTEFDPLLGREDVPYLAFRLKGDEAGLTRALRKTAEALRINFPGYTGEVRYTDRVLRFPSLFGSNGIFPDAVEGIEAPDPGLLYATATGDPGDAGYFPLNAVRWVTPPRDLAALVTDSGTHRFEARLYHFGGEPRTMSAELYLLEPGAYTLSVKAEDEREVARAAVQVDGARTRVSFELPPQTVCRMTVEPVKPAG